jgi:DUF4097 and DUF4098 domain-containing protein YvlB
MKTSKRQRLSLSAAVVISLFVAGGALSAWAASTTKSFPVKKGGELSVQTENTGADISIHVWDRDEVKVVVDGIPEEDIKALDMSESGNRVVVEYYAERGNWRRSRNARFNINVPSEFSLELSTAGGDIEVEGKIKGKVDAGTSGGDVSVDDVQGSVELSTSGGDVTTGNVDGDASLKTSGGDIDVRDVTGMAELLTSGGDIQVGKVGKDLEAKTAGGDVVVKDVGGHADVATAGGDIQLGAISGSADLRTAGGDVSLEGANGKVIAKTAGGDIQLRGVSGSIEAETAGGDISGDLIPTGGGNSSFETKGGDIELMLPENAKVTIDADIRIYRDHWGDDKDEYDIYSDFKPESKEKDKRGIHAKFILNGGGPKIVLETIQGDIHIVKRSR